jgi:chemotaxis protein MotA
MANGTTPVLPRQKRKRVDLATIIGLICGFILILTAIALGGDPKSFFNLQAVIIVIGGTFAVVMMCFSLKEMSQTANVVMKTFVYSGRDPSEAAIHSLEIAELARKRGVLSLQGIVDSLSNDPFLLKGVAMLIDGTPGEEVETIMGRDLNATIQRHNKSTNVLRRAAEFAPAMGLIGTLIGLVKMLSDLQDPSTIGPNMAVALLTTFYGAVLANMVFMPLANKLERNSAEEALINNIYVMCASSIGRQENPRRLEMLLNSILPPAKRIQYFD